MSDTRYRSPTDYKESNSPPREPIKIEKRSHKVIKYYLDAEGSNKAPTTSEGNLSLNFGTVLQGQSKRITLYAKNTIEYDVQLEPIIENNEPDLKITRYPPILKAGDIQQIDIVFHPDIDRLKPLECGFDFRKTILTRT